jgi:glutamate dehydrogenase/leucine dehydrogenase
VIFGDPDMPLADKERLIRVFAKSIEQLVDYIPGPDTGTDETAMAWVPVQSVSRPRLAAFLSMKSEQPVSA